MMDFWLQIWRSMNIGGAYPLPLMSKGENDEAEDYVVAIKSKGGDCWHYDSGVVLDGKPIQVIKQEGRRKYVQQVRPRRYTMQNPRPGTQASRSGGASTQCTHFKTEKSTWGFLVWYLADGFVFLWCRLVVLFHVLGRSLPI